MQKHRENGWMVARKGEGKQGGGKKMERQTQEKNETLHLFPLRLGFSEMIVTSCILFMAKCTVYSIQGRLLLAC